jgi:hypothetical protein
MAFRDWFGHLWVTIALVLGCALVGALLITSSACVGPQRPGVAREHRLAEDDVDMVLSLSAGDLEQIVASHQQLLERRKNELLRVLPLGGLAPVLDVTLGRGLRVDVEDSGGVRVRMPIALSLKSPPIPGIGSTSLGEVRATVSAPLRLGASLANGAVPLRFDTAGIEVTDTTVRSGPVQVSLPVEQLTAHLKQWLGGVLPELDLVTIQPITITRPPMQLAVRSMQVIEGHLVVMGRTQGFDVRSHLEFRPFDRTVIERDSASALWLRDATMVEGINALVAAHYPDGFSRDGQPGGPYAIRFDDLVATDTELRVEATATRSRLPCGWLVFKAATTPDATGTGPVAFSVGQLEVVKASLPNMLTSFVMPSRAALGAALTRHAREEAERVVLLPTGASLLVGVTGWQTRPGWIGVDTSLAPRAGAGAP